MWVQFNTEQKKILIPITILNFLNFCEVFNLERKNKKTFVSFSQGCHITSSNIFTTAISACYQLTGTSHLESSNFTATFLLLVSKSHGYYFLSMLDILFTSAYTKIANFFLSLASIFALFTVFSLLIINLATILSQSSTSISLILHSLV